MQTEVNNNEIDVIFNGDICHKCRHNGYCVLITSLQCGIISINDSEPFIYCPFYIERTLLNMLIDLSGKLKFR